MDRALNCMFLIMFVLLISPKFIEFILDYLGKLAIPQDELMPRYLLLCKMRASRRKDP